MSEQLTSQRELTVLIIDDDISLLPLIKMVIIGLGLSVETASNAVEGLAMVAAGFYPDLIMLDIKMPGMDGFDTFNQLRANPRLKGSKIIALTAFATEEDRERILNHGFDYYISKPFKKSQLIEIVKQSLVV
ncbi:MAG: response regulator [Acidobacteriota bacterium]